MFGVIWHDTVIKTSSENRGFAEILSHAWNEGFTNASKGKGTYKGSWIQTQSTC